MEIPDFIEVYKNAFSKEYCDELINLFNEYQSLGMTKSHRDEGKSAMNKEDNFLFLSEIDIMRVNNNLVEQFNDVFWDSCYPKYFDKYNVLSVLDDHAIFSLKLQKTKPGEGYHVWHCEQGGSHTSKRLMVFTVYLNDDYDAGETEFLYQQKRIKGNTGDVCIFPASYTHTHRGNPPMNGEKYILTGWVEF